MISRVVLKYYKCYFILLKKKKKKSRHNNSMANSFAKLDCDNQFIKENGVGLSKFVHGEDFYRKDYS